MKHLASLVAFVGLCGLWVKGAALFGAALAVVFVGVGSVLLLLAALGYDALHQAYRGTLERCTQGLREPRDTLTHILMLAEHSRRNGLLGLGDVETNWPPLQRVCSLVASAADEQRIRLEAAASVDAARQRGNLVIVPWAFLALSVLCTGALGGVLVGFSAALAGESVVLSQVYAPLFAAFGLIALLIVPVTCRLVMAREREISCIQLAYEGALKILHNNNVDAVFHALAALVPGAPATVVVSEIGDLDTGRGPWL